MVAARAGATSNATMLDNIRVEVRDPATDRSGNAITNTRFTTTDLQNSIKHTLMYLQREMRLVNPSDAYVYTDGSYTAAAFSSVLPGAGFFDPIVKIENIEDSERPLLMPSIPFDEIERYALSPNTSVYVPRGYPYRTCLIDGAVDGERHVIIRPRPASALPIRVWRIGPPVIWTTGDNHPLAAHWEDLMILLCAKELVGRLEGLTPDQNERLAMILGQFRAAANRRRQPQRIRRQRVGWS